MKELLRSNDAVLISFIASLLKEAGFSYDLLDRNMSVMEGSLGVLPTRVMVANAHFEQARTLLKEADIEIP